MPIVLQVYGLFQKRRIGDTNPPQLAIMLRTAQVRVAGIIVLIPHFLDPFSGDSAVDHYT